MKLTRSQKRSCKLTDNDIYNIRREYEICRNYRLLGRVYGVSTSTIKYWVDGDEYRKHRLSESGWRCKIKYRNMSDDERKERNKKTINALRLRNEKYPEYHITKNLEKKEYHKRPDVKQQEKEYRERNKERINKYNKEYYEKPENKQHRDEYYREYNKEYFNRSEVQERLIEYRNRPEVKEQRKENSRRYRERHS